MFNKYLLIAFLIFANIGFAQNRQGNFQGMQLNGKITGKIIDAQTKQIIEYCNVVLFSYRDSAMVNGTITDKEGKFTLSNLRPGFYFLRASYIGYDNRTIDSIRITPNKPEIDLGVIALDEKTIELSNVVVTGEKEVIINNLDKKVINVEKDLTNLGGTAVDVVQNIPSVTVDADGNVSYRGNQNVRILIDGKPSELLGLGSGDVLSNIPASQIESIELVTNPSARYDPEGTGGILNIVLKKRINGGLNGTISLTGGTKENFNGSLNFNYKFPDINFFFSIDSRIRNSDNSGSSFRTNNINNVTSYLDQFNDGTFNHFGHNFTAGIDVTPDNYNTFTFSTRYRKFGFDNQSLIKTTNLNSANAVTRYFERSGDAVRRMNAMQYTLSYKRTFDTKGAEFTTDIIFGDFKMTRDEDIVQKNFTTDFIPTGEEFFEKGLSDNKSTRWTFQSNYINPIEGFGRIETGFEINLKNFNSKNDYLNLNNITGDWSEDLTRKTDFDYKENIYAVYGIYSNNIDEFKYQFGLRAEQADVKGNENLSNSSFTNDYFALYPTVHLVQGLPSQQEIQLSYSRRVERPNNRRLNPYVDRSDSLNIYYGNPELKPEFTNSLELGYSKLFNKTALTSSIFYRTTQDAITEYTIVNENGITERTWENLAKNISYGLELTFSSPLFDWFRTNTSFTYFNNEFDGLGILNSDNSWMAKMNNTFSISKDFNLQINLNYDGPRVMAQTKMKEQFVTDFAVRKDFLDGQLSVSFRLSDVFNTRKWESETFGQNFITSSYRKFDTRIAYLGITYRLSPSNNNKDRERRRPQDEEGMDEF
ncbi:TonB-dependent receptor [Ignavibacterium sp.]|uniref:TonB-dependent receptor domain-containing protein n=1 Tax=Ignavibacterium sp. TaxID=2651167 RepID=UPI0022097D1D|nr:TonB-dependent receptor [Ignavibacterium sp.]BDQ02748.1 MAG: TonB-dependent receptor [Ignavibacterium sp.]